MVSGPLTIHGNRRLFPREDEAVAFLCVHGVLLVGTSIATYRHFYRQRILPGITTTCIVTLALLRMATASMELHLDPSRYHPNREENFATLDAVALVPFMLMIFFYFLDNVVYRSQHSKGGLYTYIKRWQLIALAAVSLAATAVYITGCVLALQVDRKMPYVFQAGVILYVVLVLLILVGAFQFPLRMTMGNRIYRLSMVGAPVTIRLLWSVVSTWSVNSEKSRFSPFRDSAQGVYTHLGMVLVMEFLASVMLCTNAEAIDDIPEPPKK
ncbi:hypothetical protein QBC39DRAFT_365178 [Podospora conica]|nr:hypothetical protein QBC39DRAFT_365178 [Schizothecium conicum]